MGLFKRKYKPVFITTKSAFTVTLVVIALTIIIVWQQGLHIERSVLRNSLLSTSILSGFLFSFMVIGLYKGFKLKDNLGRITDSFKVDTDSSLLDWVPSGGDGRDGGNGVDLDIGDGCEEVVVGVLIWIVVTILIGILLFIFGTIVWFSILLLLAILYWIFFRGLRLVFKKSSICQGDILQSLKYSFLYTSFSTLWLICILFVVEHQNYSFTAFGTLFQ